MRRALVDMRADRFEDLIALVALYRPGPMANIPTYCARKLGEEEIEYLHPSLEPILKETFGVITYQEQVQQIGKDLAGYTLAEADLLRRAMGKKIKSEMDAQRTRFLSGAAAHGIPESTAIAIFEACAKFAEYGFNKSHSAPYAFITYQTAWMKANHPVEFLAASMTLDINNTDKLSEFRGEAQRLGVKLEAPSVNRSGADLRSQRRHHFLCAGGPQGRRRTGGRTDRGGAAGRSLHLAGRFRKPGQSARDQQAGDREPRRRRRVRRAGFQSRPGVRRRRSDPVGMPAQPRGRDHGAERHVRRRRRRADHHAAADRAMAAGRSAAARIRRHRIFPFGPSARRLRHRPQAPEGAVLGRVFARGQNRRDRRQGGGDRGVADGAAYQDRQQDGHHRAVGPDRPFRSGAVFRGACPVSRGAGAGRRSAVAARGGIAGRGCPRPRAARRTAGRRRGEDPEGPADICPRYQAAGFHRPAAADARGRGAGQSCPRPPGETGSTRREEGPTATCRW